MKRALNSPTDRGYAIHSSKLLEVGMISLRAERDLRVGDTLRIIPNHVCSTVNLHDALFLAGEDGTVEEVPVAARGKVW